METRPETGPMRFGNDWTGVFIRGDNCFHFKSLLKQAADVIKKHDPENVFLILQLEGMMSDFESSNERSGKPCDQILKPFDQCVAEKTKNSVDKP